MHASSVIGILQSDIKMALKSAFVGLDGPLFVTEWCKGRGHSGDAGAVGDGSTESTAIEGRDSSSAVGEAMSPSHSSGGGSSSLKGSSMVDMWN